MRSLTGIRWFAALLLAGLLTTLAAEAASDSVVTPGSKAATLEACVAETPKIRREHMVLLKHDRVETVRKGVRDTTYSLSGCIACHASKDEKGGYKPVDDEGEFCASCHSYVAVKPACFQCHSSTPDSTRIISGDAVSGLIPKLDAVEFKRLHAGIVEE
jgi:hypothetical protein